ncbi:MAG: hypothetical protein PHV36_04560 [Elusimicrobiales bacterium]|nr:hypothetical protein [Elusimicrobiales bacterium]
MRSKNCYAGLLFAALCAGAPFCRAQGTASSTSAPAGVQSPLMLTFSKDAYSSRVGVDYSLRWDFSDLASFKPGLGTVYSGIKALTNWDITENTRLDYYGFRTNPWRLIIAKEKKSAAPAAPAAAGGVSPVVSAETPEYRKRIRLSVSPLVDDIKRNFDDGLRNFLLSNSLRKFSPEWQRMGEANRKTFVKDVLSVDIWGVPLPGVSEAKEGLEYLSEPGKKPAGKILEPLTISTRPSVNNH